MRLGGGTTHIGYGKPGQLIPVAYAAGGAEEGFALWSDGEGGLSGATFGESAPANAGPGPKPGAADRKGPKLKLVSSKTIRVTSKTTTVS